MKLGARENHVDRVKNGFHLEDSVLSAFLESNAALDGPCFLNLVAAVQLLQHVVGGGGQVLHQHVAANPGIPLRQQGGRQRGALVLQNGHAEGLRGKGDDDGRRASVVGRFAHTVDLCHCWTLSAALLPSLEM
jgi:hypothetical protein